jgi:hypothetical protein
MVAALATSAFVGQRVVVAPVVKVRSPPYPMPAMFVREIVPPTGSHRVRTRARTYAYVPSA